MSDGEWMRAHADRRTARSDRSRQAQWLDEPDIAALCLDSSWRERPRQRTAFCCEPSNQLRWRLRMRSRVTGDGVNRERAVRMVLPRTAARADMPVAVMLGEHAFAAGLAFATVDVGVHDVVICY